MTTDPLSTATRTAKRNLLAVSILAITYKAFNVTVENIPIEGLNLKFQPGAFAFLLLSAVTYFLATFALYYWIDIKNMETTDHQRKTSEYYGNQLKDFRRAYAASLTSDIQAVLPKIWSVSRVETDPAIALARYDVAPWSWRLINGASIVDEWLKAIYVRNHPNPARPLAQFPDFVASATPVIQEFLRKYRWFSFRERCELNRGQIPVNLVYLVRNYGLDGCLPCLLAVIAIAAMYGCINLTWLSRLLPTTS
jgi:hypothetical protein